MNTIAVAKCFDGSEQLFSIKSVMQILRKGEKAFMDWCYSNKILSMDEKFMDGTLKMWIIKGEYK